MNRLQLGSIILGLSFAGSWFAPVVQANQERRTIEVAATGKAGAQADLATIRIGFENIADTKDAAYDENVRGGNKLLDAMSAVGVQKEAIETNKIHLDAVSDENSSANTQRRIRYSARQDWTSRVAATQAQKMIDLAVAAGANRVEDISWIVPDSLGLEAKAYGQALSRAKQIAEQIAIQSGFKLGSIVSVSNSSGGRERFVERFWMRGNLAESMEHVSRPALKLLPGSVEREAFITVVYAIEQAARCDFGVPPIPR